MDLKEEVSVAAFADIMPPSCYMLPSSFAAIGKMFIQIQTRMKHQVIITKSCITCEEHERKAGIGSWVSGD